MSDALDALHAQYRFAEDSSWIVPAYDGRSTINLIASLLAHFGVTAGTPLAFHDEFAAHLTGIRKVLVLTLDGLGWHNLVHVAARQPRPAQLLDRAARWPLTTVFPSTTTAAMSSLATGLPPAAHGVIGYTMYFPEYARVYNMINFTADDSSRESLLASGFEPEHYLPKPGWLARLQAKGVLASVFSYGAYVGSGLSRMLYADCAVHPYIGLGDLFAQLRDLLGASLPQCHFLYWSTLDTIAHLYGAGSEAYAMEATAVFSALQELLLPHLDADTALIITADHGHIDGDDAQLIAMRASNSHARLRAPAAGEGRALQLFLKPEEIADVRATLTADDRLVVLTKEDVLARRLLGTPLRDDLDPRLGDLLLLPRGSARISFDTARRPHTAMIGRHGGLSMEEMVVPLLVYGGAAG